MAFIGPLDAFNSKPIQSKVGTVTANTKPLFTATSTKVARDSSGKVIGATTTLYYSATPGNYVPAATTKDGGKTWTYLKDSNGKEILGADAKNSLTNGVLKNNTQAQIISATKNRVGNLGGLNPIEQKIVAANTKNNATKQEEQGEITSSTTQEDLLGTIKDDPRNAQAAPFAGAKGKAPLSYPLKRDPKQDYIMFTMYEYSPRQFLASQGSYATIGNRLSSRDDAQNIVGSVALPIQPTISDNNVVNWQEDNLSAIEQIFGKVSLGTMLGGVGGLEQESNAQIDNMNKDPSAVKSALAGQLVGAATGTNKNLFTRTTGAIINPNAELLFQGPGLRTFSFTFTLSARSAEEAKAIRSIIRFFKQGMAAKRAASNLFLKTPNTFGIKYMYNGGQHPWINKIKECALQNFSVNYTPAGNYSTFPDGAMTQYDLMMSFGELDPIYFDEYKSSNEIGY